MVLLEDDSEDELEEQEHVEELDLWEVVTDMLFGDNEDDDNDNQKKHQSKVAKNTPHI